MDCLCRDGEIPGGSCERKFQAVAFVCDVRKFKFPSVPVVLCWRVGDEIVGLARMNKPVRNCVWRAAMSCSRIYALCGRKRWEEIRTLNAAEARGAPAGATAPVSQPTPTGTEVQPPA